MRIARRAFAQTCVAGLALAQTRLKRRPNILVIAAEGMAWGDLSRHGNPYTRTSTLDSLAQQGVEFTRFLVSPAAVPSLASLLTGRYSARTGVDGGGGGLARSECTLARAMRESGYHTAYTGDWPLGGRTSTYGFDEYTPTPASGYATAELTAAALRFLDQRHDPYFLWLAYRPVDVAAPLPERYVVRPLPEAVRTAVANLAFLDDSIFRLLTRLDDLQAGEDTIVVFTATAGPATPRFNAGLRGVAGSVYEGGLRVPLILRWSGHIPAGRLVDRLAAHIDLYPTLLELSRAAQPDNAPRIDGRTLGTFLSDERPRWEDRPLFVRAGALAAARIQRFTLINGRELYDVEADPGEAHDAAAQHGDAARYLGAAYQAWLASVSRSAQDESK